MKRVFKFLSLSGRDRALLLSAMLLLAAIRLGLVFLPFQTLRRLLGKIARSSRVESRMERSRDRIIWAVETASRYLPGQSRCLARALTAQVLLSRQGYEAQIRIGVAKDSRGHLEAHAWVESQGNVVLGRLSNWERFTPLPHLDAPRRN
ncbi:lasso peptide biosynthesis B2 protein [Lusitaniella coriacea LEGE 07157]|uniref:Lasso peptide biosynthesis B2 protein n=1 Tax=Lusitaniella coriacea LEGE 07157 TaxID=945747 RepID=A0A8J7E0I5_9CYAN|nr:lasso peptide biosynthesis B2 protein [Lusitaniella coriacea]MBE9117044.1 lasso peptide biosynthesis B2 protein [Lusitaniella coriacea LEGE 07157]